MDIERDSRRSQVVNLTPLIDVVFLLIVFFMLSTSFVVSESMELSIPTEGAKQATSTEVWVLRVLPDDRVYSGQEDFSIRQFNHEVRARLKQNPEQKMLVLAANGATVQQLVNVLDVIYLSGGTKVQIDHDAKDVGADVRLKQ